MVADAVEIITSHTDDNQARHLSLRSVHGKYLIQLLDKQTDEDARSLGLHGTLIKLGIRPSAELSDIIETARRWIVVPGCEIEVKVDDAPPVQVGFSSLTDALKDVLQNIGASFENEIGHLDRKSIKIDEKEINGVTIAYALEWSEFFRDWSFLEIPSERFEESKSFLGTCVEGIRVDFNTAGFDGINLIAIANTKGPNAPRTNVVRSGLELTPERDAMLRSVYSLYCDHVRSEIQELHEKRQFSITWAIQESMYLLFPLLKPRGSNRVIHPLNMNLLIDSVKEVPALIVEDNGKRLVTSSSKFSQNPQFWLIDCALFRSAEMFIREVGGSTSLSGLIKALHADKVQLPSGPILCWFNPLERSVFRNREVDRIEVYPEQRRVDLRWVKESNPPRCREFPEEIQKNYRDLQRAHYGGRYIGGNLIICNYGIEFLGLSDEIAVCAFNTIYLLPDNAISKYFNLCLDRFLLERTDESAIAIFLLLGIADRYVMQKVDILNIEEYSLRLFERVRNEMSLFRKLRGPLQDYVNLTELNDAIKDTKWKIFNPSAWVREDIFGK